MTNPWLWFPNSERGRQYVDMLLGLYAGEKEDCEGFRLVMKPKDNVAGGLARRHVDENSPTNRPGIKAPLSLEYEMFLELQRVKSLLSSFRNWLSRGKFKPVLLRIAYKTAEEIFAAYPHLFRGNDTYLWEEMAWYWEGCGEIKKAIRCLLVQAQLQPGKTDAWLNLGAVYGQQKMWGQAVETYLRGLRFDPEDRYIRSNLNQILADKNVTDVALEYLDTVAAKYPDPFNLLIAGDLYEMLGMNKEAVARYARGARKAGPDNRAGLRCLTGLVKIFLEAQEYEKARPVVEQTLACWKDDKTCLEQAVELYSAEEEVDKLKKYALRLVQKYSSVAGHQALARCYLAEGDVVRAKEHVTRARKLQGR